MPPDLNSLPPSSPSPSITPLSRSRMNTLNSPSPRSNEHSPSPSFSPQSTSLAAAATMNAGLQNEERRPSSGSFRGNPSFERRRSSVRMNLSLNDPTLPAPGELAMSPTIRAHNPTWPPSSPTRHARQPSLGELHQELESEQEAQVNRLLSMIRQQQAQIQVLQSQVPASALNSNAIDDSDSSRAHTPSQPTSATRTPAPQATLPRSLSSRQSTHRQSSSHRLPGSSEASPALRPHPNPHIPAPLPLGSPHALNTSFPGGLGDEPPSGSLSSVSSHLRDESTFYQAETQMLTRENQMLKNRIRELERQAAEMTGSPSSTGATVTHSPVIQSSLHTAPVRENTDDLPPTS